MQQCDNCKNWRKIENSKLDIGKCTIESAITLFDCPGCSTYSPTKTYLKEHADEFTIKEMP